MTRAGSGGGGGPLPATIGAWAGLLSAVALSIGLSRAFLTEAGVVGEVAAAWAEPPSVWVALDPPARSHARSGESVGVSLGPLRWSPTRPTLLLGALPLQVNAYTGGLPDWPTRLALAAGGPRGARALHLALGVALVVATWVLGRRWGGPLVGALAALLLATRWDFLVWRAMLGGTELALIAANLCLLAAFTARPGRTRPWGVVLGLAFGLHAKVTFVLSAAALWLAAGRLSGGARPPLGAVLLGLGLGALPAGIAALMALQLDPAAPVVRSHDSLALQGARVMGMLRGVDGDREQLGNLARWLWDPAPFLVQAWGADPALLPGPAAGLLLGLGWLLALLGMAAGWRRSGAAGDALRGLSLALPAQVLLLLLFARDLHHLGQAAATAALWAALCTAALARRIGGERRGRVAVLGLVLALPAMIGGPLSLEATDRLLRSAPAPTLSTSGQAELVRLLDENHVSRVVLCDYEASGALELLRPGLRFENAWGAASRGEPGLVERLVGAAAGDHLLVLRASAPLIYNRAPSPRQVEAAAAAQGLRAERVGGLSGGRAELYRILSP